jgi:pimeloyl-ACP methyl ester carboxylesterase
MHWAKTALLIVVAVSLIAAVGFFLRPIAFFNAMTYVHEDLSGVESRYVEVAGHRVHYLAQGRANGPVIVLVHGLGSRAEDWDNLTPFLVNAGFRVYRPDLLGYGRSDRPADFSFSIQDEASVVVGFLDALGLKHVDLGGWSMGGWIAQLVALQHPERVLRLMLFDSAGLLAKPGWNVDLFMPTSVAELDQLDALLFPEPPQVPAFVARDILRNSRNHRWVIKRAIAAMLSGKDVTDNLLPQLKMPVLIASGSLDRITPLDLAETMHRLIPQSQLDVIAGCGHMAPLQCSEVLGPEVVNFVRQ